MVLFLVRSASSSLVSMVLVVTAPRLMESRTAAVLRALSTGANFLAVRRWTYARAYRPSGRKMMDVSGIVNWF